MNNVRAADRNFSELVQFVYIAELRFGRPMTAPFRLGGGEIGFEDLFLNHIQHIARLERAKVRAERKEDPISLAAMRMYRMYRPGRANALIRAFAQSQNIPHDNARRELLAVMSDRANDRQRMNARDHEFLKEIWD